VRKASYSYNQRNDGKDVHTSMNSGLDKYFISSPCNLSGSSSSSVVKVKLKGARNLAYITEATGSMDGD